MTQIKVGDEAGSFDCPLCGYVESETSGSSADNAHDSLCCGLPGTVCGFAPRDVCVEHDDRYATIEGVTPPARKCHVCKEPLADADVVEVSSDSLLAQGVESASAHAGCVPEWEARGGVTYDALLGVRARVRRAVAENVVTQRWKASGRQAAYVRAVSVDAQEQVLAMEMAFDADVSREMESRAEAWSRDRAIDAAGGDWVMLNDSIEV